jgi:uncharacterized iron-regulated membrane protein
MSKAAFLQLHKIFGLTAAAFLFVQALSGLVLVFGPELARLVDPAGMTSGPGEADASPAKLIAVAEDRHPGYRIDRLVYPAAPDGTYLAHLDDGRGSKLYLSLDRHEATVLREGGVWRYPVVAALNIHDQWLIGMPGTVLVTASGVMLLLLSATGLGYWWPRRGRLRKSITIQWRLAPRLVVRQVHRSTGAVISTLLVFMAITGLFISIPMLIDGPASQWASTEPFAPRIEAAIDLARQRYPSHEIRDVRMQGPTRIAVFFRAPERNSRAVHRVIIDTRGPHMDNVLGAFENRAPWIITLPLHSGEMIGLPGRLLIFGSGLALALLAFTGPLMWYQARARRRPKTAVTRVAAPELPRGRK